MSASDPAAAHDELARAQQMMRDGSLDAADALLARIVAASPLYAGALYLRGVIANRRGDYTSAIAVLDQAIAAQPDSAQAWLALGNAYAQSNDPSVAANCYDEARARAPTWFEAHYNLGLMRKAQGRLADAARAFHAAWRIDPSIMGAGEQCVATTAAWVRNDPTPIEFASIVSEGSLPSFSIVVCSIDESKLQRVLALYRQLFAGIDHDILTIRNAKSLAEAYNWAFSHAAGDIVVLSHDDIDILASDFARRVAAHLQSFDVLGIVGAVTMTGPAPLWSSHPHLRGWVTHRHPDDALWRADVLDSRPIAGEAMVLDGVLLAAKRAVLETVAFDAETFDGFHLYDVDWSYRAAQAGYRLSVAGDLLLVHQSRGRYDQRWEHYAERFCDKHRLGRPAPPTSGRFFEAVFDDPAMLRPFYARLASLSADEKS